jgi:hypothetical protein
MKCAAYAYMAGGDSFEYLPKILERYLEGISPPHSK